MLALLQLYGTLIVQYMAIAFGVFLIYFKGRHDNNIAQERKDAMETLKGIKIRDKIQNDLSTLSDNKLNKLYDKETKRD